MIDDHYADTLEKKMNELARFVTRLLKFSKIREFIEIRRNF